MSCPKKLGEINTRNNHDIACYDILRNTQKSEVV